MYRVILLFLGENAAFLYNYIISINSYQLTGPKIFRAAQGGGSAWKSLGTTELSHAYCGQHVSCFSVAGQGQTEGKQQGRKAP